MKNIKYLVFGCSGSIGLQISKKINNKNTLFLSRAKPKNLNTNNWKKFDLKKKITKLPKKVEKIYFLASPYYVIKNFNKKKFYYEYIWLKKIINNVQTKSFIYFSSSSVYLKNHPLGHIKLLCEKLLLNSKIEFIQIWRPFNIIGFPNYKNLSDHFHNLLIKNFIKQKKKSHEFLGSENDRRGYSTAKKFAEKVIGFSKKKTSFIYNYGNTDTINIKQIVLIFLKLFNKKYKKSIKVTFKNKKKNVNIVNTIKKIKTIKSNENSKSILKNYFVKLI
tara:strand:- start:1032 stop:1859 length:828 start_codon:yes stop_codon:yes gene_type:complete